MSQTPNTTPESLLSSYVVETQSHPHVKAVAAFHRKFGLDLPPTWITLSKELNEFRAVCLKEELTEYVAAIEKFDLAEALDALVDLSYFAHGTLDCLGFGSVLTTPEKSSADLQLIVVATEMAAELNEPLFQSSGFDNEFTFDCTPTTELIDLAKVFSTDPTASRVQRFAKNYLAGTVESLGEIVDDVCTILRTESGTPAVHWLTIVSLLDQLIYVARLNVAVLGFTEAEYNIAFETVHTANMSKVRTGLASNSKRGSSLDITKPPGWTPPDMHALVESFKAARALVGEVTPNE